jgi:hypothetical protein
MRVFLFQRTLAMTINASVGTCIAVSAALPATHDNTGFTALTFTQIGELESIGDLTTTHAAISFANMCTGKTSTLKGVEEAVTVEIMVALDRDDAGQTLMTAARKSANDYAFQVTEANGDKVYFTGKVMKSGVQYGGIGDVKKAPYSIGVTAPKTGDTFVVFNAV